MPARCSVPGCSTKTEKGSGSRFYCIPSVINFTGKACPLRISRRQKWIVALKLQHLQDHQLKNIRICSHHFVTGKPADQYYVNHPDWVPSQRLNLKESKTAVQAKSDFLNKLQLDGTRKPSPAREHTTNSSDEAISEFTSDELHKYSMPQKRCCVASCLNRMSKTKNSSPSIHYFKFPEDYLTRSRWIFLCQRKGTWDPDHCYICSVHFISDNYNDEGELSELAVPTINLFSSELGSSKPGKSGEIVLEGKPGFCSISWCKSKDIDGKRLELFPQDLEIQKTWIENIYGASVPVIPSSKAVICEDHFEDDKWVKLSSGRTLKKGAVPTIFHLPAKLISSNNIIKKKTEFLKEKEPKLKSNPVKKDKDDNLNETLTKLSKSVSATSVPDKVVRVVRVVKRQFIGDHTYSGMDSADDDESNTTVTNDKKKIKIEKTEKDSPKQSEVTNINNSDKPDKCSEAKIAYDNIEELMADLMGEDISEKKEVPKVETAPLVKKSNSVKQIQNSLNDSLDDYSDYSETDSDSDLDRPPSKSEDKLSFNELKEIAEAQKFQLKDLKSENQELIEENERLRNELQLLKTDPEHASLKLEKSKFMSLIVKLFRNFLNVDQILCLIKSEDPSTTVVWSNETLNKALEMHHACSDTGYDVLVEMGFPLPPRRLFSMLDRNKTQVDNEEKDT